VRIARRLWQNLAAPLDNHLLYVRVGMRARFCFLTYIFVIYCTTRWIFREIYARYSRNNIPISMRRTRFSSDFETPPFGASIERSLRYLITVPITMVNDEEFNRARCILRKFTGNNSVLG